VSEDRSNRIGLIQCLSRREFCKQISDLLVMVNISRVGAIELLHSVVIQDSDIEFSEIPEMDGWALQRAVECAEKMQWPHLEVLDIQRVWSWTLRNYKMLDGFEGASMGRALCAFSRLFERSTADEPMQLLWALIGLEALYTQGNKGLSEQLREKAQVFLGPQVAFKKKISQMYHFRSRFIHGDLDFGGLYLVGEAREAVAKFDNELLDAISVAVALLVGTIQEVIRRNWTYIRFEYKVADSM